jgi:hypothetical protein
MRPALVLVFP